MDCRGYLELESKKTSGPSEDSLVIREEAFEIPTAMCTVEQRRPAFVSCYARPARIRLLSCETTHLQRPAGCGIYDSSPVVEAGHRVLLSAEKQIRPNRLLRTACRGHEDRIRVGGNVNGQPEVISNPAGKVHRRVHIAASAARLDHARRGEGNDIGKPRIRGLSAIRYPHRGTLP
jgi:hypothetical protein